MKKIIFSVLALLMGAGALTGCSSWIEEDPESLITDDMLGDSEDATKQWVTGVYSKWVNDMFRWGYFPRMLEQDADYISGPDWLFGTFGAGNFQGEPEVPDALWNGCYNLIGRANLAEREIRAMNDISDAVKNTMSCERTRPSAMPKTSAATDTNTVSSVMTRATCPRLMPSTW